MRNQPPKVLIVDDNPISRSLIGYYLRNFGCVVSEVENGSESLIEIQKNNYDLIVLDWRMPILDGYQTLVQGDQILSRNQNLMGKKLSVVIYSNLPLADLNIPKCNHFSIRAMLSKKLTPFQQLTRIKKALEFIL